MTLTAFILLNGVTTVYTEVGGTALDNFTGPGFVLSPTVGAVASGPAIPGLEVIFVKDADGTNPGAWIDLGDVGDLATSLATGKPSLPVDASGALIDTWSIKDSYTFQLFADGVVVPDWRGRPSVTASARVDTDGVTPIPAHGIFQSWRFQSARRPIVRTPADISGILHLPYGALGVPGLFTVTLALDYIDPMDASSVYRDMPGTGGRPDIGPANEWAADWLRLANAETEEAMRSVGEVSASLPYHFKDPATRRPVDLISYPRWNSNPNSAPNTPTPNPFAGWYLDTAHHPDLPYVPAIATGDPFFLRECGYQAVWALSFFNAWSSTTTARIDISQQRTFAWILRSLLTCYMAHLQAEKYGPTPSWLNGSASYKTLILNQIPWTDLWRNNPTPAGTVFATGPGYMGEQKTWEDEFIAVAFGLALIFGLEEFRVEFEWKLTGLLARCGGDPGWPWGFPSFPAIYCVENIADNTAQPPGLNSAFDIETPTPAQVAAASATMLKSYGAAYVFTVEQNANGADEAPNLTAAQIAQINAAPDSPDNWRILSGSSDYLIGNRTAWATAVWLKYTQYTPQLVKCDQIVTAFEKAMAAETPNGWTGSMYGRWSVQATPDGTYPPFTPLPKQQPITNSGGISVTTTPLAGKVLVGATAVFNVMGIDAQGGEHPLAGAPRVSFVTAAGAPLPAGTSAPGTASVGAAKADGSYDVSVSSFAAAGLAYLLVSAPAYSDGTTPAPWLVTITVANPEDTALVVKQTA